MWNQLKDATRKADMGMKKCQKLFMAARYTILEASRGACGTIKANLVYALVLILSGDYIVDSQGPFVAGQLKFVLKEWTKITSDPYILQCVSSCSLEFY